MIGKEDYEEPRCVLNMDKDKSVDPIPVQRVIEKLDAYYARNDVSGAERHLLYWLSEALAGNDKKGEFTVRSELVGHYRKEGNKEKAIENADAVNSLIEELKIGDTVGAGTAYLNIGTVYKAFGREKESLIFFEKATAIYEKTLDRKDARFGGLYNNYALTLVDLKRFTEAYRYYEKALSVVENIPFGKPDAAITYLNIATAKETEKGYSAAKDEIKNLLKKAKDRLDGENRRDGYYAFVCSKCATAFSYYGDEEYAEELIVRAKEIYERA
ncbi:MAG: tetratricopeptide repeat protein [Clostridia bacterium]|nr:tetratricopeptide repeat protein [Clostridia bacterium]